MNQQTPYPMNQGQQPMYADPMYANPAQVDPTQQPQGYAPQSQQQTQPPAPEPTGKSGLAIAALVLGIVAVATCFMPIINNASFFIALVGLVLAIIGFVQTRKGTKSGAGLAIAAIVLNIVAAIAVLASQAFYSSVIDEAFSSASTSSASSSSAISQGTISSSASSSAQAATANTASEYEVTIDDATMTTDYAGNPALLVTFTWTNNSDDATSFAVALHAQCFQDGVQCDTAIVSGMDSSSLNELKPGASTTVQQAYEISGTSDATVEVTKLISFDDTILAEKTFSVA